MSSQIVLSYREKDGVLQPVLIERGPIHANATGFEVDNQNDFEIRVGVKYAARLVKVTGRHVTQHAILHIERMLLTIENVDQIPDFWVDAHMLRAMLTDLRLGNHIHLIGPKGTGKTTLCRRLAKEFRAVYQKVDCAGIYKPKDLVGSDRAQNGTMIFVPTDLVRVLEDAKSRSGCPHTIVNFDELSRLRDGGDALHPLLDDERQISVTTSEGSRLIELPKGVVVMATSNPIGGGNGGAKLAVSLRDRFEEYTVGYPPAEFETRLLVERGGISELDAMQIVKIANELRKQAMSGMFPEGGGPSPRRTLRAATFVANGFSVPEAIEWKILNQYEGDVGDDSSERSLAFAKARATGLNLTPRLKDASVMHLNGGK